MLFKMKHKAPESLSVLMVARLFRQANQAKVSVIIHHVTYRAHVSKEQEDIIVRKTGLEKINPGEGTVYSKDKESREIGYRSERRGRQIWEM